MSKATIGIIAVIAVVAVMAIAMIFVLPGGDDEPEPMTFNGTDYTWEELEAEFGTEAVGGYTGIPLGDVMLATTFGSLDSDTQNETLFNIMAEDGWQKNVSWMDMQTGILIQEDLMTYFPDLPGAYKVKNVASIDDVPIGPIAIITADASWASAAEVTFSELFNELDEVTVTASGTDYVCVSLVDVFDYAGYSGLENATFTFEGVDGYSKSVNWTGIETGYLTEDGYKTVFEDLPGSYRIRNIIRITIEL